MFLDRAPSLNEPDENGDDGDHEQDVDEPTCVESHITCDPGDQEDDGDDIQ